VVIDTYDDLEPGGQRSGRSACAAYPKLGVQKKRPRRGISVVMGWVSRPLNLSSVKEQTVSPWSRRALEVEFCQSEPCRPATCQPE